MDLDWAVCILHAIKTLPATHPVSPIADDDREANLFGWVVTLIPRVGIVRPF